MIAPKEIQDDIKRHPPLQKESIAQHYKGIEVTWDLEFRNAFRTQSQEGTGKVNIIAASSGAQVLFVSDTQEYPDLNLMRTGDHLVVTGKILKADDFYIEIENSVLSFPKKSDQEKDRQEESSPAHATATTIQSHLGSVVHIGDNILGDKISSTGARASIKGTSKDKQGIVPVIATIATIVVAIISIPWWPNWWHYFVPVQTSALQTTHVKLPAGNSIYILDILDRYHDLKTSLERENFLSQYRDETVIGTGIYEDVGKSPNELLIAIQLDKDHIVCKTTLNQEKRVSLLKLGQSITFSGSFLGLDVSGKFFIRDCMFVK